LIKKDYFGELKKNYLTIHQSKQILNKVYSKETLLDAQHAFEFEKQILIIMRALIQGRFGQIYRLTAQEGP